MKYPNIVTLESVCDSIHTTSIEINGKWYPARAIGFMSFGYRVKAAWLVFTGKADALVWPADQ